MTTFVQRLNLGCGTSAAAGWVNVDGSWAAWLSRHPTLRRGLVRAGVVPAAVEDASWPKDVIVHDLRRSLPFHSESFDAVYASHVLEHLYLTDARRLLVECFRILRPGGVLRIVVPDLRDIVEEYAAARSSESHGGADASGTDPCERLNGRLMLRHEHPPRGPLHLRLYAFFSDFHSHKWVYDAPHLIAMFQQAGFEQAGLRGYLESAIEGIAHVERGDRVLGGEGICVEGRRGVM